MHFEKHHLQREYSTFGRGTVNHIGWGTVNHRAQ